MRDAMKLIQEHFTATSVIRKQSPAQTNNVDEETGVDIP